MNTIQILALLALVSMAIPATFAVRYWLERNYYLDELYNADQLYYDLLRDRDWWRNTAYDLSGQDTQFTDCNCTDCEEFQSLECPF